MTLTASELSQMRADLEEVTLPDTCVIQSIIITDDGEGGFSESFSSAATVDCRMDFKSGVERVVGGAVQAYSGWMLTVPQSATITAANRVTHGGHTYAVEAVSDTGSWLACKRAQCQRVS